ncbi:hypothetical protein DOY81_013646, partial [Sarcophaga bullata]
MIFRKPTAKLLLKNFYIGKGVSTWTPLATAFNSPPYKKINFTRNEAGLFCMPELRSHEGFFLLKDNVANKTDDLIQEAISGQRQRKIVQIFDELSDSLCKVADLSEFIRIAHPQSKFTQAAEDACISISGIVENLNTHKDLYLALRKVVEEGDHMDTTEVDKHVAKLFLFDFEQSGIHLKDEERDKVVRLNDYILQLGQKFMHGAVQPTAFPQNPQAREAAYRLFLYPSERQEELLSDLLKCRHVLAQNCGFETYAHRALNASTSRASANGGKRLPDGSYQLPIVVVMLNLSQPRWTGPTLLSPSRVDNLFHEMGHAMHSMLARTEYQHVTGTRCSTDFAEVPSVLMEYFASDPRVLRTFAKHFQTHKPMDEDMLQRLCASKNLFSASETQLQVFYSALDQIYHSDPQRQGSNT